MRHETLMAAALMRSHGTQFKLMSWALLAIASIDLYATREIGFGNIGTAILGVVCLVLWVMAMGDARNYALNFGDLS